MPSLTTLAGWESAVIASIERATGTIEDRDAQIRRSGLYGEYPAILRSYLDHATNHATNHSDKLEALKRAVFIVWLAGTEPSPYSGIAELPEADTRATVLTLEAWARADRLDEEFADMLAWYHSIAPFVFEVFGTGFIADSVGHQNPQSWREHFTIEQFQNRGQLGKYWRSVVHPPDRSNDR